MAGLHELIARLAARGTADDHDRPALDLGVDRSKPTPFPSLPWTPHTAAAEGERLAPRLAAFAPPSLLRALRTYGPVELDESVVEHAIGRHWPHVPLDQIANLESLRSITSGFAPYIGDARCARGVALRARWDDPQLVGCADLSPTGEPIWLLYTPPTLIGDHLMPLARSYDDVLLAHLVGVDLILTLDADAFDAALDRLARIEPELVPFVLQSLVTIDEVAAVFSTRADVYMRVIEEDDIRSPGLDEGAARVRTRVRRMRERLVRAR